VHGPNGDSGDLEDDASSIARCGEMLANRIAKNARGMARWLRREGIGCHRVYDCDIPEVALTIDRYATRGGGAHAVIAVWQERRERSQAWIEAMRDVVVEALELAPGATHVKVRARQEGLAQYDKLAAKNERHVVEEDGLAFLVNLDDYLDTGLFLDHRVLRRRVRAEAADKDVLNLFAYTGAISLHAAAGGARTTTSVDLSQTYLDWARDNFAANGIELGARNALLREDILQWLADPTENRWDLAVVDPPTFSNSKKMRTHLDVQRDHAWMLARIFERMRRGGVVYFSTNARKFKLDDGAFAAASDAREISHETVPRDFRDRRIHRAWRITLP
jgi:23S rRNA G2069 N7-methylase RlmK/C1962 C5-methylase RlmI